MITAKDFLLAYKLQRTWLPVKPLKILGNVLDAWAESVNGVNEYNDYFVSLQR
jgi:hypothetical protein